MISDDIKKYYFSTQRVPEIVIKWGLFENERLWEYFYESERPERKKYDKILQIIDEIKSNAMISFIHSSYIGLSGNFGKYDKHELFVLN